MIPIINPGEGGGSGSGPVGGGGSPTTELSYIAGKNLKEGNNITLRPAVLTSRHLYNLRNQSWAIPKPSFNGNDSPQDLITQFHNEGIHVFPSNSDTTGPFIYQNTASDNGSKYIQRFNAGDSYNNALGNSFAPIGFFIIDVLDRGASRKSAYAQMMSQYPINTWDIEDLPTDETPTGPTVVAEFAGRVFYSGFPGIIIDGDSSSPKLSSYVLFSQLVRDSSGVFYCYQSADPTSADASDLVDTDGGFIRIDGAYNINALANIQSGLVVLAENGAWVIQGGSDSGFTATNYKVIKVSNVGCISPRSAVVVNNALIYWGKDGIYNLTTNQYGDFVADNISRKTIQTFYDKISSDDKLAACGIYDEYEQKVKWIYGNRYQSSAPTYELSLDMTLGAYTKYSINRLGTSRFPMLVSGMQVNPFTLSANTQDVVVNADQVVVESEDVIINIGNADNVLTGFREVQYLVILNSSPTITFTFGNYTNVDHYDWKSVNGIGIDAKSYLLTGALAGGDYQRKKDIMYITTHFTKTENGLVDDGTGSGDLTLRNQSSCLLQAQWDWTNSVNSNRWGTKQQVYRIRQPYFPTDPGNFDNGYSVVETRTKLRGSGKAVSLLFESSPGKHLEILGWSMTLGVNGNV